LRKPQSIRSAIQIAFLRAQKFSSKYFLNYSDHLMRIHNVEMRASR